MSCSICGEPVVLAPSVSERVRRYGGSPADYAHLQANHAACVIRKRDREARELMRNISDGVRAGRTPNNILYLSVEPLPVTLARG